MTDTALDLQRRSVEVILANQTASGAFIAGPTFSQYGYCWFRDGAFIAYSLDLIGQREAAERFHCWVSGVVLGRAESLRRASAIAQDGTMPPLEDCLHCRYSPDGMDGDLGWPAFQLDGPGIWLWALGEHLTRGGQLRGEHDRAARLIVEYLSALWPLPSYDAWEESSEHVHAGTLGAIATGLRAAGTYLSGHAASEARRISQVVQDRLRDDYSSQGYISKWASNPAVDASLLWLGHPYQLLDLDDPLFENTLARIERELVSPDGGVHRYRDDTYYGGGEWILLTASLGLVYCARGRAEDRERALACLGWIERQADANGLLPEQVDVNALHRTHIVGWQQAWGASARPLLWSHAMYLALRQQLSRL